MHNGLMISAEIVDQTIRERALKRVRELGVPLPTFADIATGRAAYSGDDVDPDSPRAENLARIHWFNDHTRRGRLAIPAHVILTKPITGIESPIIVLLGSNFPLISAHKVLPAYSALVTRLISGRFDPDANKAIWPSTGNYCRGGVAVSRILGCHGIAVLPEGMSRERFEWLSRWVRQPENIIRTPGTESNVKEIYDECNRLRTDPNNIILNQFADFTNYLVHYSCTSVALESVFDDYRKIHPKARIAAFVSATGSAGTIAAGDALKTRHGSEIVAVEALECPTLLENGYGEHNIQGIGDKHVPLIHNVLNLDAVVGVSDHVTDRLHYLFCRGNGTNLLTQALGRDVMESIDFKEIGLSGFANIAGAIRYAREKKLGARDVVMTLATDSSRLYLAALDEIGHRYYAQGSDPKKIPDEILTLIGGRDDRQILLLNDRERRRIFNLGYYTWVEQQNITLADFDARKNQEFWHEAGNCGRQWDHLITAFNHDAGFGQ